MGDPISAPTTAIGLTVLAVESVNSGKLFALVAAEIEIEGVRPSRRRCCPTC
jgi:hypothetical protein